MLDTIKTINIGVLGIGEEEEKSRKNIQRNNSYKFLPKFDEKCNFKHQNNLKWTLGNICTKRHLSSHHCKNTKIQLLRQKHEASKRKTVGQG